MDSNQIDALASNQMDILHRQGRGEMKYDVFTVLEQVKKDTSDEDLTPIEALDRLEKQIQKL